MPDSLCDFLRTRAQRSFNELLKEISDVSKEDALLFAEEHWPDHRWGVGQNGSIAGIVYHVAAWKQMTLPAFEPGGEALNRDEFDPKGAPELTNWPAITAWLTKVGEAWKTQMLNLSDDDFDEVRRWESNQVPLKSFIVEMYEHDIQHASQIAYIKQIIAMNRNA